MSTDPLKNLLTPGLCSVLSGTLCVHTTVVILSNLCSLFSLRNRAITEGGKQDVK